MEEVRDNTKVLEDTGGNFVIIQDTGYRRKYRDIGEYRDTGEYNDTGEYSDT